MGLAQNIQPEYVVLVDDVNITQNIKDRLISLSITDEDGFEADTVKLTVADPKMQISMPRVGVKISVLIGYDGILNDMGFFIVDEVTFSGMPHQVEISAKGAPFDYSSENFGTLQDIKNRSWTARTLGELLNEIAKEHDLKPAISKSLDNILLPHIDQIAESDMNLLTRQAKSYDAVFKALSGRLILSKKGDGLSISGKELSLISLSISDISSYEYSLARGEDYQTVKASYRDIKAGKDKTVTVGDGKPIKILKAKYPNEQAAKSAAEACLKKAKRGSVTFRGTVPGNPLVRAGSPLSLSNFRSPLNQNYIIQNVTHTISATGGYTTEFTAEDEQS